MSAAYVRFNYCDKCDAYHKRGSPRPLPLVKCSAIRWQPGELIEITFQGQPPRLYPGGVSPEFMLLYQLERARALSPGYVPPDGDT